MKDNNFHPNRVCTVYDSSNVLSIAYDFVNYTLRIQFKSGLYDYSPILPAIFGKFVSSDSVGSAVNDWLKSDSPKFRKVSL